MLDTYLQHQALSREAGLVITDDAAGACAALAQAGWREAATTDALVARLAAGERAVWRLSAELPHQVYELICNLPHGDAPVLGPDGVVTTVMLPDGANLILAGNMEDVCAIEQRGIPLREHIGMAYQA